MESRSWFEDESFWREGYRFMFSEDAFRVAREQVEQVITLQILRRAPSLIWAVARDVMPYR
jgi:hypothetical protein